MGADNLTRHHQVCMVENEYETIMSRIYCNNIEYQRTEYDVEHDGDNIYNNKYKNSNNMIHQFSIDNLGEEKEINADNILCICMYVFYSQAHLTC